MGDDRREGEGMKDMGLAPNNTLSPAEKAVEYFLKRLLVDSRLAWYCGFGTAVFEVMMEAAVARRGLEGEEAAAFEENFANRLKPQDPARAACASCARVER